MTISPTDQSRSVTPAAIAGGVAGVLFGGWDLEAPLVTLGGNGLVTCPFSLMLGKVVLVIALPRQRIAADEKQLVHPAARVPFAGCHPVLSIVIHAGI